MIAPNSEEKNKKVLCVLLKSVLALLGNTPSRAAVNKACHRSGEEKRSCGKKFEMSFSSLFLEY
jgi:hypothetical protein